MIAATICALPSQAEPRVLLGGSSGGLTLQRDGTHPDKTDRPSAAHRVSQRQLAKLRLTRGRQRRFLARQALEDSSAAFRNIGTMLLDIAPTNIGRSIDAIQCAIDLSRRFK